MAGSRLRKAFARDGDDATLSRFVKIKDDEAGAVPRVKRNGQLWLLNLRHKVLETGRSIFWRKGVKHPNELKTALVSGHSNAKIGRDVRKGRLFRGYWIFTLSLEERATCPRTCHHWETCYGNNMPYAKRVSHEDLESLEAALVDDIERELSKGRAGLLVRLHALGDFFSTDYVAFWATMLSMHPQLAVFGYTARDPQSDIGRALTLAGEMFGDRFAIRWSNGGGEINCTVSVYDPEEVPETAFLCPEQTGKTRCCATCGLCWNTKKNVAFLEH